MEVIRLLWFVSDMWTTHDKGLQSLPEDMEIVNEADIRVLKQLGGKMMALGALCEASQSEDEGGDKALSEVRHHEESMYYTAVLTCVC